MKKLLFALSLLPLVSVSVRAATYTFVPTTANTSGGYNFSDTTNWNNGTATGVAYPSTTADTANIGYTGTSTQTVTYDTGASGTFGTLNMANTGTGTNVLDIFRAAGGTLTLVNGFTLGSTTGINQVILDAQAAPASGNSQILSVGTANTVTLNGNGTAVTTAGTSSGFTGGILEFHPFVSSATNNGVQLTGNLSIAGGILYIDQGQEATGQTQGSSSNTISGNLSMSSGSILFGRVITPGTTTANSTTTTNLLTSENRLLVGGNTNITGGNIVLAAGTGFNGSSTSNISATMFMSGATNVITGTTGLNTVALTFSNGTANATVPTVTFTTDQVTATVIERFSVSGKNLSITNTNTATTGNINQLQFVGILSNGNSTTAPTVSSTSTVTMGSDLRALSTAGSNAISATNTGLGTNQGSIAFTLELAGHTYDLTNTNSVYTPTNPNAGANQLGSFTYQSSTGTGTIKAVGFNFSSLGGTVASFTSANGTVVPATPVIGTAVGPNVVLNATGGNSTASNLSASSGSTGTISATSIFLYSGAAVTATPATLTATNRAIGMLSVSSGFLQVNPGGAVALTTGGAVTVTGGGLDISGTSFGALTLSAGNFSLSNATLVLTLSGSLDTITAGGSGQSFALTNATIALNGTNSGTSYQVFNNFTGANTVTNVTFTNVPAGQTASLSTTGLITFSATAVPEPGTWVSGLVLLAFGGGCLLRRRIKA